MISIQIVYCRYIKTKIFIRLSFTKYAKFSSTKKKKFRKLSKLKFITTGETEDKSENKQSLQ